MARNRAATDEVKHSEKLLLLAAPPSVASFRRVMRGNQTLRKADCCPHRCLGNLWEAAANGKIAFVTAQKKLPGGTQGDVAAVWLPDFL